jgi:hypothetical protein
MYYEYRQNNSRGYFKGPAKFVYVEADNADAANVLFQQIEGCYFDPWCKFDCECCGPRWYSATGYDAYSAEGLREQINNTNATEWMNEGLPKAYILHANGTKEVID